MGGPADPQEAEQEKALFLNADNGVLPRRELAEEQASLLVDIDANYEDAVHLMMSARTQIYSGKHAFAGGRKNITCI
ncbi:hypothetical protein P4S72_09950 [Vibrio sp. PP-XX7]